MSQKLSQRLLQKSVSSTSWLFVNQNIYDKICQRSCRRSCRKNCRKNEFHQFRDNSSIKIFATKFVNEVVAKTFAKIVAKIVAKIITKIDFINFVIVRQSKYLRQNLSTKLSQKLSQTSISLISWLFVNQSICERICQRSCRKNRRKNQFYQFRDCSSIKIFVAETVAKIVAKIDFINFVIARQLKYLRQNLLTNLSQKQSHNLIHWHCREKIMILLHSSKFFNSFFCDRFVVFEKFRIENSIILFVIDSIVYKKHFIFQN